MIGSENMAVTAEIETGRRRSSITCRFRSCSSDRRDKGVIGMHGNSIIKRATVLGLSVLVFSSFVRLASSDEKYNGWTFFLGSELYKMCKSGNASDRRGCTMY